MGNIIGIDLGTTNSLVATVDAGFPLVIADPNGRRLVPSVVHYPDDDTTPLVGEPAKRLLALKPRQTIYSIKRLMGRRSGDLGPEEFSANYLTEGADNSPISVLIHNQRLRPEEISAEILTTLKSNAEQALETEIDRAVITVPAYFNDAQRNATIKAGEIAGLKVERIINEPTAAALAYGLNRLQDKTKIAVYDLGGGTFDLSILELNEGIFRVLATNGNTTLGGDDIDKAILDFLVGAIEERFGADVNRDTTVVARLREAAEAAKIRLSSETRVDINLPFLKGDLSLSVELTRDRLESMARDIILKTKAHCIRALADAKMQSTDLSQVILVGGQTRMPLVRQVVAEIFNCSEFEETRGDIRLGKDFHRPQGPELNTTQNPDEVVALGAAIQAEILSGGFKDVLLLDVTPLSLGIETFGGLMNVIIPRNSTIPIKAGETFTTAVDNQKEMLIHTLQGERERAADNWSLGNFTLEFDRAPKGVPRVGVQFELDANGVLHVLARDIKTGKEKVVTMSSAVDVDDDAVQQMVEESVEHAFEDLEARRWIETKLKAQALLDATDNALSDCHDEIDSAFADQLRHAVDEVRTLLSLEDPDTKTGNVRQLRTAMDTLDETSKPLAEIQMEKVMTELLEKQGLIS